MYPGTWREVGSVTYRAGGKKEGIPAFPTNPTEKKEGQARRSGARRTWLLSSRKTKRHDRLNENDTSRAASGLRLGWLVGWTPPRSMFVPF